MSDCLVEQDGHVLIVTMNRPERRNALSSEMLRIMEDAWDRVNSDDEIRVCILTGAGGYFCAGMDLKTADEKPPSESFESGEFDPSVIKGLLKGFRLTKPLIAAVEGPAIAGGTEILQGTDIRVAGESAKFGVAEARWSLYPMGGSAVRLPRQIPYTVAAELLLTGRTLMAAEAKELGLIGHVVPDGQALAKAREIADMIGPVCRWGRWEHADLTPGELAMLDRAQADALGVLADAPRGRDDWGLIHADLRPSNIMTDGETLTVIDFDDCGYGWFGYDFAAALSFIEHVDTAPAMASRWLAGYEQVRPVTGEDVERACALSMIRRLQMLGWTTTHREDALPAEIWARQADGTVDVAARYLRRRTWLVA